MNSLFLHKLTFLLNSCFDPSDPQVGRKSFSALHIHLKASFPRNSESALLNPTYSCLITKVLFQIIIEPFSKLVLWTLCYLQFLVDNLFRKFVVSHTDHLSNLMHLVENYHCFIALTFKCLEDNSVWSQ